MPDTPLRTLRPAIFPVRLLADPGHAKTLHTALWLYLVLRAAASPNTGRLQATLEDLAQVLAAEPETVSSLLGRLRAHRYVETRRIHGQVEIRILDWSPPPPARPPSAPSARPSPGQQARSALPRPPRGPVQSSGGLAQEIAEAFGDLGSLGRYEELVESFPEAIVRRAFREARLMPRERVRKNRGALFTYLLKSYAHTRDQDDDSDNYED